jgi:hypothetical protein
MYILTVATRKRKNSPAPPIWLLGFLLPTPKKHAAKTSMELSPQG